MVALQIRDVPDEVRDALAAEADERGQSLQGYLLDLVRREVGFLHNRAVLADLSWATATATADEVLVALDDARAQRGPS